MYATMYPASYAVTSHSWYFESIYHHACIFMYNNTQQNENAIRTIRVYILANMEQLMPAVSLDHNKYMIIVHGEYAASLVYSTRR